MQFWKSLWGVCQLTLRYRLGARGSRPAYRTVVEHGTILHLPIQDAGIRLEQRAYAGTEPSQRVTQ
jgi:hypothetical protein